MDRDHRPFEPWPYLVGGALATMIGVSLSFFWIATSHPDTELLERGSRPGLREAGVETGANP